MQIPRLAVYLAMPLLFACGQQQDGSDIDPLLGTACFDSLRDSLPPGTQYEGVDALMEDRLTIRIMNGVEVTTVECGLNTDGSVADQPG